MPNFVPTIISGIVLIGPDVHADGRGYFFESYNQQAWENELGPLSFVQDNQSRSVYGVLRGLHYQLPPFEQSKLVRVVQGSVFDVAVDIRPDSPTYGRHVAVQLSGENHRQLFIPKGCAHGFVVTSAEAVFQYKVDNYYSKEHEQGLRYDDPLLGIDWPLPPKELILSERDRQWSGLQR